MSLDVALTHKFFLRKACLNVAHGDLSRLGHNVILVLRQMLKLALVIDHLTNGYESLVADNWRLAIVQDAAEKEFDRVLVVVLHLGQNVRDFVL